MPATVAIVHIDNDYSAALQKAIGLIGGLDGLNSSGQPVTIKIGLFDPRSRHHSCPQLVGAIIDAFDQAPHVYLAESDNYCGKTFDRLQPYSGLYSERVTPFNLSDDPHAVRTVVAGEEMDLGHVLFEPHVLVSTHVLRSFLKGSVLKNLFGCTPMVKKAKYHKTELFTSSQADIFAAAGGIKLAVMDGTNLFGNVTEKYMPMNLLIVGRDAVAVETVGAVLAGNKPSKVALIVDFAARGLGVGDMDQIEIVGVSADEFNQLKKAHKELKKRIDEAPKTSGLSHSIDALVDEGWLDTPRTSLEVTDALLKRGVSNATKLLVETTLKRRVGKNIEREKVDGSWMYHRKQG